MKILLDIDGVIANFYADIAQHLNTSLNTNLDINKEPEEYSIYAWNNTISKDLIDSEVSKWIISGGYKNLPMYPNTKEFLTELTNKYDVHTVTARIGDFKDISPPVSDIIRHDTYKWFENHNLSYGKLIFEHKKIDYCKNNDINIIIEDKPSTAEQAAINGIKCILMQREYNQNCMPSEYIIMAEDFDNVLKILENK